MPMYEFIQLACKNLGRRKIRTSLVTLGVGLSIALVVSSMSFSEGFSVMLGETMRKIGADIFVLPKGQTIMTLGMQVLPEDYTSNISKIENVRLAIPVFGTYLSMGKRIPFPIHVWGVPPEHYREIMPYAKVKEGRFFEKGDNDVALLGSAIASSLKLGIGDEIAIGRANFTIIGILEDLGTQMEIYVPLSSLQKAIGFEGKATHFLVFVEDKLKVDETVNLIESELQVSAHTYGAILEQAKEVMKIGEAFRYSWWLVVFTIGILFILSVMIMAVSERTREIGIMRAIGASRGYIFKLILTESIIIGLLAGAFGCIFGTIFAKIGEQIMIHILGFSIKTVISTGIVLQAIAIAFLIACLGGLYPAIRASKIEVAEALRYE